MSTLRSIETASEWEAHLASLPPSTLLIVSFYANWAGPCKPMAAVLEALASKYPVTNPPTTSWVALDAESLDDVCDLYGVTAVPFLVLLRNGQVVETVSGNRPVQVREAIERHANPDASPAANASAAPAAAAAEETDPAKAKEELFRRLGDLVKAAPVMLFMKGTPSEPQCGFSRQLVAILRENKVKYGFFNILADDEVRQGLKEFAEWPTFPQLWADGELVGGLDIVSAHPRFGPRLLGRLRWSNTNPCHHPIGQGGAGEQRRVFPVIRYQAQRRDCRCRVRKQSLRVTWSAHPKR